MIIKNHVKLIIYGAFVIGLCVYIYLNRLHLYSLLVFSPTKVALVAFVIGINTSLRGATNYYLYRKLGATITLIESTGLAIINTIGNLLPLSGGLIAKGAYLKSFYQLNLAQYFSSTLAVVVFQTSISGIIALIALASISFANKVATPYFLTLCLVFMSASSGILMIPLRKKNVSNRVSEILISLKEGWTIVSTDWRLLARLSCLHAANVVFEALRFYWIFSVFSTPIPFHSAVLFSATGILTRFVNLAPGGIGVREAIIGGLGLILGLDLRIAVTVVVFDRIIETLLTFIVAFPISASFLKRKRA